MAKLNETATTILTAAAARDNHHVLPVPKLKAPPVVVQKTLKVLLAGGMLEQIAAHRDDEVWEESDENGRTTLVVTPAGLAAVGIEVEAAPTKPAKGRAGGRSGHRGAKPAKTARRPPGGDSGDKKISKQDTVIALLRRANGASIEEMMEATDWQAHSVRGLMSGALKKRLGLTLVSEKTKAGERRYYIAPLK
jgi:hypothetical protein